MRLTQWQQERQPVIEVELARMVERLARLGVERIVLFGSHARGHFHEGSDIDLLVVMDTAARFFDRTERVLEAIDSDIPVEPLVYTPAEIDILRARRSPLLESIEQEGRVLYERRNGPKCE